MESHEKPSERREAFYSHLERLVEAQPAGTKKSPEQWQRYFTRKQMSSNEMNDTGVTELLEDWDSENDDKPVSREDLLKRIRSGLDLRGVAIVITNPKHRST